MHRALSPIVGSCPPEMPRRPGGIAHRFWIVTIIAGLVRRGFRPPREPTQTPALLLEAWSEADRLVPERFIPIRRLRCPGRGGADVPQPAAAKRTGIRESLNTAFRCLVCPKPEPDCPKPGVQRNGGTSGWRRNPMSGAAHRSKTWPPARTEAANESSYVTASRHAWKISGPMWKEATPSGNGVTGTGKSPILSALAATLRSSLRGRSPRVFLSPERRGSAGSALHRFPPHRLK